MTSFALMIVSGMSAGVAFALNDPIAWGFVLEWLVSVVLFTRYIYELDL